MNEDIKKMDRLEQQIGELLELCGKLGNENSDLRAQITQLNRDRATLIEQKETARSHVESMITRLRSMEHA